jgi:hypothetical protein
MAKTTTTELPAPFTPYACARLRRLRSKRLKIKDELDKRLKERNSLKDRLQQMGKDDSPEKRKLATEFWEAISAIEGCRTDLQDVDEKIDKTIEDGDQLELIPGLSLDDDPPESEGKSGASKSRRRKPSEEHEDEDDDRPVGEPAPRSSPRPGPDLKLARPAPEPWHDIDVGNIGLPDRVAASLRNAELPSLGAVVHRGNYRLTTVGGVSPKDESHIEQVIDALREGKTREEAVEAAESAGGSAPKGGKRKKA